MDNLYIMLGKTLTCSQLIVILLSFWAFYYYLFLLMWDISFDAVGKLMKEWTRRNEEDNNV